MQWRRAKRIDMRSDAFEMGCLSEAGFSVPHFHRIFTACEGEDIAGDVRRVRLERAGRKLWMGQWTLSSCLGRTATRPLELTSRQFLNWGYR
jgi:AraC-like DNA-binding protein